MEKRGWEGKAKPVAALFLAAFLVAGFFAGSGIRKCFPVPEEVAVYSVEGLRDKTWSDTVSVLATVEAGSLTAYYYDSRKPAVEFYVAEGQFVEAGTPLLRYDCAALEEELSGLERSLENQEIYLKHLGSFIENLKGTKPVADGAKQMGNHFGGAPVFVSAEESLEGLVENEGQDHAAVVYERIDGTAVPAGGSGTAQDPYVYYLKKGGEVAPEAVILLMRLKLCGRFVIVEDEESLLAPLFSWTFDGKAYEDKVQGESPAEPSSEDAGESVRPPEGSTEETSDPSEGDSNPSESNRDPSESNPDPSESTIAPSESAADPTEDSEEEDSSEETKGEIEESDPSAGESTEESSAGEPSSGNEEPDFEGEFGDEALDEAMKGLEDVPQGYTKEELMRAIGERCLEYEKLELAIRKKERQVEELREEIEENILVAKTEGQVRSAISPKEAARAGQPMLTIQGAEGFFLSGRFNELLAASLKPGDRLSMLVRTGEKERSFAVALQAVEREPEETEGAGKGSGTVGGNGGGSGNGTDNPAMSYYRFQASPAKASGLRAGDTVELMIPRELLGGGTAEHTVSGTMVLPDTLLFYENGSAFVYVMDQNNRLEKRQVETGRSFLGTETEILSGITEEDYLAYPEEAAGLEGAATRIVYGEEMEIGTKEAEE